MIYNSRSRRLCPSDFCFMFLITQTLFLAPTITLYYASFFKIIHPDDNPALSPKLVIRFPEHKTLTWLLFSINLLTLSCTFFFLWKTAVTEPGILPSLKKIKRVPQEFLNSKKSDPKKDIYVQYKTAHELE